MEPVPEEPKHPVLINNPNIDPKKITNYNFFKSNKKRFLIALIALFIFIGVMLILLLIFTKSNPDKRLSNKILNKNQSITTTIEPASSIKKDYSIKIIDTNQNYCFNESSAIACGSSFLGQDGEYKGYPQKYKNNNDGTISDLNTELMWIKDPGKKITYQEALENIKSYSYAGYSDWRIPTIKELYTLMDFSGTDPSSQTDDANNLKPFINTEFFDFEFGDISKGNRVIDSQWITSTIYNSTVMNNEQCFFGVNFADGRIKCYPTNGKNNGYYLRLVRGNNYSSKDFTDNKNETITDNSTGLIWQKNDSKKELNWEEALNYCNNLNLASMNDWRLPNAKELQFIVDYSRGPDKTNSPAINSIFDSTSITNEKNQSDYPYYWTSTTHLNNSNEASMAIYISFGRGLGKMNNQILDVHGAGSQRSDPKVGNKSDYPTYFGPQGDVRRVYNYARCVRGGRADIQKGENPNKLNSSNSENTTQQQTQPNTNQEIKNPPNEAISACGNISIGSTCSFGAPNGNIKGVCQKTPEGTIACIPG